VYINDFEFMGFTFFYFYLSSKFKKGDIFFNYGCLPRTWEDPTFVHPGAEGCRGDNDPLDICEIGLRIVNPGVSIQEHFSSRFARFLVSANQIDPIFRFGSKSAQLRF